MLIFIEKDKCDSPNKIESNIIQAHINKLPKEILQKIIIFMFDESYKQRKCHCDLNIILMKEIGSLSDVCTYWKRLFSSKYFIFDIFNKYYLQTPLYNNPSGKYHNAYSECKCHTNNIDNRNLSNDIEFLKKIQYDKTVTSAHTTVNIPDLSDDIEMRTAQFIDILFQLYPQNHLRPFIEGPNVISITKEERALFADLLPSDPCVTFPNPNQEEVEDFMCKIGQKIDKMSTEDSEKTCKEMLEERNKMMNTLFNSVTIRDCSNVCVYNGVYGNVFDFY